jgi:hypothetical protein
VIPLLPWSMSTDSYWRVAAVRELETLLREIPDLHLVTRLPPSDTWTKDAMHWTPEEDGSGYSRGGQ